MRAITADSSSPDVLGIYLNDHLAGATAGVSLARRLAATPQPDRDASAVRQLAVEIAEDRSTLVRMMTALGVPRRAWKVALAWLGERVTWLKLRPPAMARSRLTLLEQLESMRLGVEGKAAGWRTLRVLADSDRRLDPALLDGLIRRAWAQSQTLEELRVRAAEHIVAADRPAQPSRDPQGRAELGVASRL